ncbi:MAG: pyridoxamine 5'-phosphate oxidase family protein [Chloroflexota bacterium]
MRRATLVTVAPDGRPRPVPCCFALGVEDCRVVIDTPIDAKPKASHDPMALARVRDIRRDARVSLLVDHWDEDWARLAWLRVEGRRPPAAALGRARRDRACRGGAGAPDALPPIRGAAPWKKLPIIRIAPGRVTGWAAAAADGHDGGSLTRVPDAVRARSAPTLATAEATTNSSMAATSRTPPTATPTAPQRVPTTTRATNPACSGAVPVEPGTIRQRHRSTDGRMTGA